MGKIDQNKVIVWDYVVSIRGGVYFIKFRVLTVDEYITKLSKHLRRVREGKGYDPSKVGVYVNENEIRLVVTEGSEGLPEMDIDEALVRVKEYLLQRKGVYIDWCGEYMTTILYPSLG